MASALRMFQLAPNKHIFNKLYHYSNRTMRTLNQCQFRPLSVLNISTLTHQSHSFPNGSFHRSMSTTQDKDDETPKTEEEEQDVEESDESSEEEVESDESEEANAQISDLQVKVQELESEVKKYQDALARSHAEKVNIQNMNKKDMENTRKFATKGFSKDMLSVMDSLDACSDAINKQLKEYMEDENIKSVVEGVKITQNNLTDIFGRHGITKIEALNKEFDPNYHEALFKTPTSELPPDHIVQVISEGYMLKDTVLRAPKVGLSTEPPQPVEPVESVETVSEEPSQVTEEETSTDSEDRKE